jgi:hypothetical protein
MLPLSHNAQEYTRAELFRRAGIEQTDESAPNPRIHYGDPDQVKGGAADIIVVPCSTDAVDRLRGLPPNGLDWLPVSSLLPGGNSREFGKSLPVLLWGAGRETARSPFVERRGDGVVVFNADIFAASFFMLSRWEEYGGKMRDDHDRFPATASVAYRQSFLDTPIVDEYAAILAEWLKALFPRWKGPSRKLSIELSHDIDLVQEFGTARAGLWRAIDLTVRKRQPWAAVRTLAQIAGLREDPCTRGIFHLASLSRKYNFPSVFNFMTGAPSQWDEGYNLSDPLVRTIIQKLSDAGFEIGFHPSYRTMDDPVLLAREKENFDAVVGPGKHGARQHYLRFRVPASWHNLEKLGFAYDSTLGFADYEGFRAGTCRRFRPFDVELDRTIELWEVPLIVMDATLNRHRGLTPEQGKARILDLAKMCKSVGGTLTLLWHNSSFDGSWKPWGEMYSEALKDLSDMVSGLA